MTQQYFLSYSRRQFYFAESVVLHLQAAGLPIWFDAQELAPGEVWAQDIEQGLENSLGAVFIASRTSLESKWCTKEWGTVMAKGRPVYVVLFEACELPPELAEGAAAIVDMRGNFGRKIRQLVAAMKGEQTVKDPVPLPNRLKIPLRLPLQIGLVVGFMLSTVALLVGLLIYFFFEPNLRENLATDLLMVALLGLWTWFVFNRTLQFLRRDFVYRQILAALVLCGLFYVLLNPLLGLIMGGVGILMSAAPDVYRWLPTGAAPAWLRERYGLRTVRSRREIYAGVDAAKPGQVAHFYVHHAPEDAPLAARIQAVLTEGGHLAVDDEAAADHHILVLSNKTPVEMVNHVVNDYAAHNVTPVMASNVNARDAVKAVGDFQFVDYRQHSQEQLEAVAFALRHPDEGKFLYGIHVLPRSSSDHLVPPAVQRFTTIMWVTALFNVAVAMLAFGSVVEWLVEGVEMTGLFWFILFWHALLAVLLVGAMHLIHDRMIAAPRFRWMMAALLVLSVPSFTLGVPVGVAWNLAGDGVRGWLPGPNPERSAPLLVSSTRRIMLRHGVRDLLITALVTGVFSVLMSLAPG